MTDLPQRIYIKEKQPPWIYGRWNTHEPTIDPAYVPEALLEQRDARIAELQMFIASDVARLVGYCSGFAREPIILDDDPMDYIRRMSEGLAEEAARVDYAKALQPPEGGAE